MNCITPVGHDAEATAMSVLNGMSHIEYSDFFFDEENNPIKTAAIEGIMEKDPDEATFMAGIAEKCLMDLCEQYFENRPAAEHLYFFLGLPSDKRPGPRFEGYENKWITRLETILKPYANQIITYPYPSGNASAVHGIIKSRAILAANQDAVCLIGGMDSLLSEETLSWFETDRRLKTDSPGRYQGMFPAQAAGFFVMESGSSADKHKTMVYAEIIGSRIANEPFPIVSKKPSRAEGLSNALYSVMTDAGITPFEIDTVVCDLSGEHHRFTEWGMADVRCLSGSKETRQIIHPADCMGSIGAASVPVFVALSAACPHETFGDHIMIFCSDDHGERGAVVLKVIRRSS